MAFLYLHEIANSIINGSFSPQDTRLFVLRFKAVSYGFGAFSQASLSGNLFARSRIWVCENLSDKISYMISLHF